MEQDNSLLTSSADSDMYRYDKMWEVIQKAKKEGFSDGGLADLADSTNLSTCSWGKDRNSHLNFGFVFGTLIGAGAYFLSNKLCNSLEIPLPFNILYNSLSFLTGMAFSVRGSQAMQAEEDFLFCHILREKLEKQTYSPKPAQE